MTHRVPSHPSLTETLSGWNQQGVSLSGPSTLSRQCAQRPGGGLLFEDTNVRETRTARSVHAHRRKQIQWGVRRDATHRGCNRYNVSGQSMRLPPSLPSSRSF